MLLYLYIFSENWSDLLIEFTDGLRLGQLVLEIVYAFATKIRLNEVRTFLLQFRKVREENQFLFFRSRIFFLISQKTNLEKLQEKKHSTL